MGEKRTNKSSGLLGNTGKNIEKSAEKKRIQKLNRKELLEIAVEQAHHIDELESRVKEKATPAAALAATVPPVIPTLSTTSLPTTAALEGELKREQHARRYRSVLRSTVGLLVVVAAVAVLVATLWMPVLQIYGQSMTPTLADGDIVVSMKTADLATGDVVAFYYNNKILVKRVIAQAGDWVDISDDGKVSVNGKVLDEPYVSELSLGECDIDLPYQVPDERVFVMGDHRSVSVDSRSSQVGCVAEEQIVGKLTWRVWPLTGFGMV